MFEIGDMFVKKNSRDSFVYEVERIEHHFGHDNMYEIRRIGSLGGRHFISESSLTELYNKIDTGTVFY